VLVIGLFFIALLASARLISTGQSARTEALVIERTSDLRDAKYFSDTVINSLPGVFYMLDKSGALVQWNENFKKAFGDSKDEMRAGNVLVTTTDEYREVAMNAINKVFETRGYVEVELDQRLSSGELRRYLVSGRYIEISGKPYLVGTGIDVTARREMEQQVRRSQSVLRTLIDAAPTWLAMIDRDGKMMIVNRRYSETFAVPIKAIKGRHYSSIFPAETSIRLETLLDECFSGREVKFDDEWNVRGQSTRFVHGRCVPVFEGESVVSVVMAIMDLTEIQNAQSRLRSANAQLERRVEEIHALQAQLQEQAIRDPLSGLFNRRYMDETLDRELARALREGYPVSVVLCDIDYFKALNDNYGHQAGDEVIRAVARFFREQARASDILCRFGGEEFLLVLPGMSPENALERVDAWRRKFAEQRVIFGAYELSATLSFGISSYPAHGDTPELLIAAADQALYVAKRKGRNRVEHREI
ncbi:MAG: diguanylate cyclase, partial [Cupriavidus sp.]